MQNELVLCAEKDFAAIHKLMQKKSTDEYFLTLVCYLYQQSIEKLLKALLELRGIKYPFTHDIIDLYMKCTENGYTLPAELEDYGAVITTWESKSRYSASIKVTLKQLDAAENIYKQLLEIALEKSWNSNSDGVKKVDAF